MAIKGIKGKAEEGGSKRRKTKKRKRKIGLLVSLSLLHVKVMLYVSFGGANRIKNESYSFFISLFSLNELFST